MDYDNCVAKENTRLASYRLVGYRAYSPRLRVRLANHFGTLVEPDMDLKMFTMKDICNILASTPHLRSIRIPVVEIDELKPEEPPEWASRAIEKMSLELYLEGHRPGLDRASRRLPQLSNLKQLERFVVSGLVYRMGKDEMAWINMNWPWLISIEVPVVRLWKDDNQALAACRRFFTGEESEL
ncbi:hypothetical protein BG005_005770 [Podila minutissima]|nr:hypothetical protein BG005_005770 [Podila minutissima]